jgi:hypothetical protein
MNAPNNARNVYDAIPGCNSPIEKQRAVLSLLRSGLDRVQISKAMGLQYKQVEQIADRGIVFVKGLRTAIRCPGCGGKILALPCVACEVSAIGLRANSVEGLG